MRGSTKRRFILRPASLGLYSAFRAARHSFFRLTLQPKENLPPKLTGITETPAGNGATTSGMSASAVCILTTTSAGKSSVPLAHTSIVVTQQIANLVDDGSATH